MTTQDVFDLIIIGSGPGGYVAAVRAAQLGLKTACIEKSGRLGGVCLNVGCIPSKALLDSSEHYHLAKTGFADHGIKTGRLTLDLSAMMARKDRIVTALTENVRKLLAGHKIRVMHGTGRLAGNRRVEVTGGQGGTVVLEGKTILLATGSLPVEVPGMAFDGERIISSTEALSLDTVPRHLGIIGGGYIGLELGSVWMRLGSKVTVMEMLPQIAPALDGQVSRKLYRTLKRQGLRILTGTRVVEAVVAGKKVKATLEKGDRREAVSFDRLLVAVGRKPLTAGLGLEEAGVETDPQTGRIPVDARYQTNIRGIHAIGDLIPGPMLAHKASAEGIAAVECIAGQAGEVNYDAIPSIIYTQPETAAVGLTETDVKQREIPYCVGTFPFSGTGRAQCMGQTEGFVKLIAHGKTDRILGVHIIGPRASDMIAESVLAVEFGAASEDMARTVHGHPTLAEALQEAAMAIRKCSTYAS